MRMRIADWMEKMSVASLAVGIFQNKALGVVIGIAFLGMTLYMTRRLENEQK